jgi:hypothetical protein
MSDEIRQIQAQQDELNSKLNEKISDDEQISKSGGRYI